MLHKDFKDATDGKFNEPKTTYVFLNNLMDLFLISVYTRRKRMEIEKFRKIVLSNFEKYDKKDAICLNDKKITFYELKQRIIYLSEIINWKKFNSIAIGLENKLDTIIMTFSCMIAGVPFIIIDKNNPGEFLINVLKEAEINTIVCDEIIDVYNCRCLLLSDIQNEANEIASERKNSQDVLFYIATSGSTGKSKVAERKVSAFWDDYEEFEKRCPYLYGKIAQQYAKLNFSYGLENSLLLLIGGTTICFGGIDSNVKNLKLMYKEIEENNASVVFWATPIIKLLSKHYKLFEGMPKCIKYIYTGGEPLVVSADLVVELRNRKIVLINDYGCSEVGKIFVNPFYLELKNMDAYNMVGIGQPIKGYEAMIMDENYCEVEEGYLVLKSKNKFPCSYVNKKIETNATYKDGFWYYNMHDMAKRNGNEIIVLGREINSVNISGYRVELEQVEYSVNQERQVEACVAMPAYNQYREATLFCFYSGTISCKELRGKMSELIPNYMIPSVFIKVDDVFLLPNGKVDRKKNYSVFGNYMNSRNIYTRDLKWRIYKYLVDIVGSEMGSLDAIYMEPFSEYGIDSLNVVDFISTVEEKEKVRIASDGIGTKITCLKDIVDLVNNGKEFKDEKNKWSHD